MLSTVCALARIVQQEIVIISRNDFTSGDFDILKDIKCLAGVVLGNGKGVLKVTGAIPLQCTTSKGKYLF